MTDTVQSATGGPARKVRFGLVGCGRMGCTADDDVRRWDVARLYLPYSHATAIAASGNAELAALCDSNEAAARDAMRRFALRAYYTDVADMLANERLDAVSIATRTQARKAIIEECVRAGTKAIYCEKPLCNTLEDADRLDSLLQSHRVSLIYGTKRRYMSVYRQVRERVDAGAIGDVTTIVVRFGRSLLLWGHPHSVDIASFFAGDAPVEYVQADLDLDSADVRGNIIDADPVVRMAHIKYANGISAHIVAGASFDVELIGSAGMATVRSNGSSVRWRTPAPGGGDGGCLLSESATPPVATPSGTVESIRTLAAAVSDGAYLDEGVHLAVGSQEVLFGFVYSHLAGGSRIAFPLERRGMTITGRYGDLLA